MSPGCCPWTVVPLCDIKWIWYVAVGYLVGLTLVGLRFSCVDSKPLNMLVAVQSIHTGIRNFRPSHLRIHSHRVEYEASSFDKHLMLEEVRSVTHDRPSPHVQTIENKTSKHHCSPPTMPPRCLPQNIHLGPVRHHINNIVLHC